MLRAGPERLRALIAKRAPAVSALRVALTVALTVAWAVASMAASPAAAPEPSWIVLRDARAVPAATPRFPEGRAATARALPDEWSDWRADDPTPVWYRMSFDALRVGANGLPAVLIQRACGPFELWLNGALVQRTGTGACHRPQLIGLPRPLLQAEGNRLDLRLAGLPRAQVGSRQDAAALSQVVVGEHRLLEWPYAVARAAQIELPLVISATLALMGSFVLVLGWRHRQERHLAYFGALAVGWALLEARRWLPPLPWSMAITELLFGGLLAFVTLAAVQFLLHYARVWVRWSGQALALQAIAMPATLALAGPSRLHLTTALWTAVFAAQITAAAVVHLRARRAVAQGWPWSAVVLLALMGASLAVAMAARYEPMSGWFAHGAQAMVALLLVIVGLRLVQLHGRALQESEASRVDLQRRVQEATAEIERNFRLLSELRVEQVTERERKRIAADLHDDLGAKLLTIVHTTDDARISTLAREALEEMRLSVRGLTGRPVRLDDALADWRAELIGRLGQSGIEAEWRSPDDLDEVLPARAFVQTTRILREATSNIIKHSRASRCTFECSLADGDLRLVIQDNGQGVPMEIDDRLDRGHGLTSMKQRAKKMQGQCLVESGPGAGTVIRLTLPLKPTVPAAH